MIRLRRTHAIYGGILLALAACSNTPGQTNGYTRWAFGLGGQTQVSPQFAALIQANAPTVAVALPDRKGVSARFVRQLTSDDGVETWITGNGVSIAMEKGMIVGTRGFGGDLMSADASETANLVAALKGGIVTRFHTVFGGDDRAVTHAYKCRVTNKGPWETSVPAGKLQTVLMQEDCRNSDVSFRNFFWVTPGGKTLVHSRQWVTPSIGYVTTSKG